LGEWRKIEFERYKAVPLFRGVELSSDGHECIYIHGLIAVIKLRLDVELPLSLVENWTPEAESKLPIAMYELAKELLGDMVDTGRQYVDWLYPVVVVESCIKHDLTRRDVGVPIVIDGKEEIGLWIGWNLTQVKNIDGAPPFDDAVRNILNVLVVRCACWQMLSSYGQKAARLTLAVANPSKKSAGELQSLQRDASRLIISYHTSLWTTDEGLVEIFEAVDRAWRISEELRKTKEVIDRVTSVLETRDRLESERRAARITTIATALALLTIVSASSDILGIVRGFKYDAETIVSLLIVPTLCLLIGSAWVVWRVAVAIRALGKQRAR